MKSFSTFTLISQVKLAFGAILSTFLISSCSDPAVVGIELAPGNNQIGVFFVEFEFPAQVVLLDSFNTTNQGVLIVGNEEDPFFGKTEGIGYSRLYIDATDDRPRADAILDSVLFSMEIVSVNGADLDKPKYYSIHELAEPFLDTVYYNYDELLFESAPFSSGTIEFGEVKDTTVFFPVNEAFAIELFGKMQSGNEFNDLFSFRKYFPGIAVKAREGDNTTAGISLGYDTGILFYYHYSGDTSSIEYQISTASSRSFNGVKSDRSGTPTQTVTEKGKNFDVGPLVGMKANLGMVIKLDTSPLDAFLDTLSGVTFNQADMVIGEIEPLSEGQTPLPWLTAYFTDNTNEVISRPSDSQPLTVQADGQPQTDLDADGNEQPSFIAPAVATYDVEKKIFLMPITSHLNALLRDKIVRKDWLLYADTPYQDSPGDDFKRSFRQFLVDKSKIKVKVIYSKTR
ncbi:MAG: DUF4270 family protein [Algoriphagus sp.]|nr:DUF4270 family protein [Algoriphagus sp.]